MPGVGAVADLRLAAEAEHRAALEWLRGVPAITLGEAQGRRIPIVVDAADQAESDRTLKALSELRGVCNVEVVYVDFEDVLDASSAGSEES